MQTVTSEQGILLVDKPAGKTSFHLVSLLRKLTGIRKIGHAGTLDPFATGVMVMLIGKNYTRLSNDFLGQDKEYLATVKLGEATDSFDTDGKIVSTSEKIPTQEEVEKALEAFQGEVKQIPPMFSAKKIGGKKLCDLARKGIEIERKPQTVSLQTKLLSYTYPTLDLLISCSKGTYIRSIADDLGKALGCGAHLTSLKRLASGSFRIEECVDYNALSDPQFNYKKHLKYESSLPS